ncbi:Zcchc7 [Phodopus roborovskii]|uniref:Zinc finger CCHC domain-containing protein 7 n=1 Tax=Phodopus roborovskii TaxID=109678 RepID=A0AAU9ZF78_PHORO|nr:Zcchc7 [Phodopus roborovskii]
MQIKTTLRYHLTPSRMAKIRNTNDNLGWTGYEERETLLHCGGSANSYSNFDGVNWFISDKDIEAKIGNNRSSGRWTNRYYSANKNVTCRNCDKRGHLSKNCPLPQKVRPCCLCSERGHLQYGCPARFCLDCSLPMSSTHRCLERSSWRKRCDRCDMIGHYADECTERRMFNQTFPTSPFIYYYDDKYEIQQRDQRIKRKVKEIQKNGDFPRQFRRPHMEETDKRGHHDVRKSHSSRKSSRWPRENKETRKEVTRDRKREKHRGAHRHADVDEDFPRGSRSQSSGSVANQKPSRFHHRSSHYHRLREERLLRESKRSKPKKRKCTEDDSNDNLFLIKQRKKKTKLKIKCLKQ